MTSAILHAGFGKCGSSALQTALSGQPSLGNAASAVEYAVLQSASVLSKASVTQAANASPFGYQTSIAAKPLAAQSRSALRAKADVLRDLVGTGGTVILSNEGWVNDHDLFAEKKLLVALGLECEVVMYVRPPVEWLNSGWWQWGAWTGARFPRWLNNTLDRVRWADRIKRWQEVPGVEKVTVRLLPDDVVSDFFSIVGVEAGGAKERRNGSLAGGILRMFQHHTELRPGPHESAIDFVLARHLSEVGGSAPWVMGPRPIERTIQATKDSNEQLLHLLDEESAAEMAADARWWDPEAYNDRHREAPHKRALDRDGLDNLAAEAMQRIFELDTENRRLRHQLENLCQE